MQSREAALELGLEPGPTESHMKVNHNNKRQAPNSRPAGKLNKKMESKRAERINGNRMKASAHKPQVGLETTTTSVSLSAAAPTSSTTTTATTSTLTASSTGSKGPRSWRLISPAARPLLILTLMLTGSLSTLAGANNYARGIPPGESRDPVGPETRAAAYHRAAPLTTGGAQAKPPIDYEQQMGLNVRESLMDLDRQAGPGIDDDNHDHDDDEIAESSGLSSPDHQQRSLVSPTRRLLVRQLTSLIMNHEPETIAAHIEGARVRGQMSSETSGPTSVASQDRSDIIKNDSHSLLMRDDDSEKSGRLWAQVEPSHLMAADPDGANSATFQTSNPDEAADNYLATSSGQDLDLVGASGPATGQLGGLANDAADQLVTCPPDYDELAAGEGSSNLDAEQQQQLLAGADSSGLLTANRSGAGPANEATGAAISPPLPGNHLQCVHPGMRMIEVITKIITPILFTIIIIVGLLGNIIVMMVILEDRQTERELTPTNLLILDLSLADLSFIIFCIPFTGWDYSVGHWVFGSLWCKFNQYLIVVCALSSIYTLVLMSIDRFMAIVYPIECISYRTSKNTLYAIYIKWILILLMASPTIAMHGLIDLPMDPHQYACRFLTDQYDPLSFQITFFITSYLFPLILIFCLYLSLLNKLWFGTKPHGHKESLKMLESKKKVTWLVAGIVVVFAICWCPIQVMLILMRLKSHKITATYVAIQVFAHTLGYMNSCVNPIVYAFASETFTNSFKRSVFGRFFRAIFCLSTRPEEHVRPNSYNYHSTRPSNATFHNTTSLNNQTNFTNIHNNNNNNDNLNGNNVGSKAFPVHHNHHDNSLLHSDRTTGCDDSRTGSTKTSGITNSCQSSYENSSCARQVALPLEPRDRVISPTTLGAVSSASDNGRITREEPSNSSGASALPRVDKVQRRNNQSARADKVLIPRGATISRDDIDQRPKLGPLLTKQQLVARVVQTGNNQATQRCETACYQQELIGP